MKTKQVKEFIVLFFLITVIAFSHKPLYTHALEVGAGADFATTVYIAGLHVGMLFMLITAWMSRRSDRNRMKEMNDEMVKKSASHISLKPSERPIIAITLIVISLVMIYPLRLYAPDAKALFIPLIYGVGILLGCLLIWIPIRVRLYSSIH